VGGHLTFLERDRGKKISTIRNCRKIKEQEKKKKTAFRGGEETKHQEQSTQSNSEGGAKRAYRSEELIGEVGNKAIVGRKKYGDISSHR